MEHFLNSFQGYAKYYGDLSQQLLLMIKRLKVDFSSILLKAKNWKLDLQMLFVTLSLSSYMFLIPGTYTKILYQDMSNNYYFFL